MYLIVCALLIVIIMALVVCLLEQRHTIIDLNELLDSATPPTVSFTKHDADKTNNT
jgi:hypothetical protein